MLIDLTGRDPRRRNALIIALKRAMETTMDESKWKEIGYLTNTIEWIAGHPRLLRSLHWGDEDYASHVIDAIEHILDQDPANLQVLLDFDGIGEWMRTNAADVYAAFYPVAHAAPAGIEHAEESSGGFDVHQYIKRIREALDEDPALAIGSTKELLESVLKTILGLHGAEIGADDMPKLLKRAQAALGLDPKDVDVSVPGGEALRRLDGSIANIVVSVTELRNLYGTGHGKSNAPGIDPTTVRLVVGVGTELAAYLMARYESMKH